jgi:hypothetical protein
MSPPRQARLLRESGWERVRTGAIKQGEVVTGRKAWLSRFYATAGVRVAQV